MELIGVIAIIAILSAVIAPNLFRGIDAAFAKAEEENLANLVAALRMYSEQTNRIPSAAATDWASAIASRIDVPEADVQANRRSFRRALYFDPRFFTSTDSSFPGYQQTSGLTSPLVSPRAILVSDLTRNAPAAPTTSAAFNAIWDQDPSAIVLEGPKVYLQRINFRSMFHRVVLNNQHTIQPAYGLGTGSQNAIPAAVGGIDGTLTRYVMGGTELRLYRGPFPGGALETSSLVDAVKSYRYTTDGTNWFWSRP